MYPKVDSIFPFSITHEIVRRLVKSLEEVVGEINEPAEADPDDPHYFAATMTFVCLQQCVHKPYMLETVIYEVSGALFIRSEKGLVEFSRFTETLSEPLGPLDNCEMNSLHPNGHVVTLEEIYRDVSRFVRHLYADEARKYIWRDGVKKLE